MYPEVTLNNIQKQVAAVYPLESEVIPKLYFLHSESKFLAPRIYVAM